MRSKASHRPIRQLATITANSERIQVERTRPRSENWRDDDKFVIATVVRSALIGGALRARHCALQRTRSLILVCSVYLFLSSDGDTTDGLNRLVGFSRCCTMKHGSEARFRRNAHREIARRSRRVHDRDRRFHPSR